MQGSILSVDIIFNILDIMTFRSSQTNFSEMVECMYLLCSLVPTDRPLRKNLVNCTAVDNAIENIMVEKRSSHYH